jgi:hypothetical protein
LHWKDSSGKPGSLSLYRKKSRHRLVMAIEFMVNKYGINHAGLEKSPCNSLEREENEKIAHAGHEPETKWEIPVNEIFWPNLQC